MNKKKVILVGRHSSQLPPEIHVVQQENIMFSTDRAICVEQWMTLQEKAAATGASLLLQNVPGILAVVLATTFLQVAVGIIISVPGERKAGVTETLEIEGDWHWPTALGVKSLLQTANGRAKVEVNSFTLHSEVKVTVDPVSEFVFSHIEWI